MTPVLQETMETFTAPLSDPGGRHRPETWRARSVDGLWDYERIDDDGTLWTVAYRPTGQQRPGYFTLNEAREQTAAHLLAQLRAEAVAAAKDTSDTDRRATGQRWLAIHLRLAGADESTATCRCGGLLVEATMTGDVRVHVDACSDCHTTGQPGIAEACPRAAEHLFCADPTPA